jgi:hypothetical protein
MGFSAGEVPTIFFHFHDKLVSHVLFYFQHTALKNIVVVVVVVAAAAVVVVVVVVVIFFSYITDVLLQISEQTLHEKFQ